MLKSFTNGTSSALKTFNLTVGKQPVAVRNARKHALVLYSFMGAGAFNLAFSVLLKGWRRKEEWLGSKTC